MSAHQVVVIGSSFAGNLITANLLKDIIPSTPAKTFKVVQIAPTDEFYFKIGAPRTLINPQSLPLEKSLVSVLPHFEKYGAEKYQFIKAFVKSIEPASKTLKLSTGADVKYDSLIIASGTIFNNNLWSTARGSEPLRAELAELHKKLPESKTIVIGGGGPAGIETAGELGDLYGSKKDITLYSGAKQLLNALGNKNMGTDAESRLVKQGIKVVHGIQITSQRSEDGKDVIELSNGETKTVDIYIGAVGDKPSTDFVPAEWLNEKKFVKADGKTMRVEGAPGVYAYGSAASYSNGSIMDVFMAKKAFIETLKNDLAGKGKLQSSPRLNVVGTFANLMSTEPASRTNNVYKKVQSDMQFVPIGSTQGVGIAFGWKIPSFMVRMAKAKDFMIGQFPKYLEGTA
jgi:apoptosis-inducing factor 2